MLSKDLIEVLESYSALARLGALFVPLNHSLAKPEVAGIVERVGAVAVLGESGLLDRHAGPPSSVARRQRQVADGRRDPSRARPADRSTPQAPRLLQRPTNQRPFHSVANRLPARIKVRIRRSFGTLCAAFAAKASVCPLRTRQPDVAVAASRAYQQAEPDSARRSALSSVRWVPTGPDTRQPDAAAADRIR
ncbi:hypothetical protein [Streptomyces sp. OP7]|uniref:hypothetical protein n=1 Tax=Streptomyces sp. OP7 TaxID=3142462 RepID=UPI0032E8E218